MPVCSAAQTLGSRRAGKSTKKRPSAGVDTQEDFARWAEDEENRTPARRVATKKLYKERKVTELREITNTVAQSTWSQQAKRARRRGERGDLTPIKEQIGRLEQDQKLQSASKEPPRSAFKLKLVPMDVELAVVDGKALHLPLKVETQNIEGTDGLPQARTTYETVLKARQTAQVSQFGQHGAKVERLSLANKISKYFSGTQKKYEESADLSVESFSSSGCSPSPSPGATDSRQCRSPTSFQHREAEENKGLAKFTVKGKTLYLDKESLCFFSRKSQLRQFCVQLISHQYFELFLIAAIFGNSIILAMNDYQDRDSVHPWNRQLDLCNDVFTWLFFMEVIIKVIALGLVCNKKSYLRDVWNIIDFVIATSGIIEFSAQNAANSSLGSITIKPLRVLRVIRPLKSINAVPSMRQLVGALLSSLPELGNVTIFLGFIFILFGTLGLQEFNGTIYNRCRLTEQPVNSTYWPKSDDYFQVCSKDGGGLQSCPASMVCGSPLDYNITLEDDGAYDDPMIQYGISSFSNFFTSIFAVFQIITRDSWTTIMYNLMNGSQFGMAIFFCTFLIIFGSFFLLNLVLAVIMQAFVNLQDKEASQDEQALSRLYQSEDAGDEEASPPPFVKVLDKSRISRQQSQMSSYLDRIPEGLNADSPLTKIFYRKIQTPVPSNDRLNAISPMLKHRMNDNINRKNKQRFKAEFKNTRTSIIRKIELAGQYGILNEGQFKEILDHVLHERMSELGSPMLSNTASHRHLENSEAQQEQSRQQMMVSLQIQNKIKEIAQQRIESTIRSGGSGSHYETSEHSPAVNQLPHHSIRSYTTPDEAKLPSAFKDGSPQARSACLQLFRAVIGHQWFTYFINFIIIANTATLAQDRYPTQQQNQDLLESINLIFYAIFLVELIIKIMGLGLQTYLADKFNIFDSIIVLISTVDVAISQTLQDPQAQSSGAISALRAFRLLRVFKLAQSWMEFQNLLITIGNTLKDISNFSVMLFIFMFIYSLLGMELFAYSVKFDEDDRPMSFSTPGGTYPDSTFNTFLESFISVFIILANDGWSTVYITHYRATGWLKSTVFFVSLLIIGQFILLNLFLAILIRNFDEQSLKQTIESKSKSQSAQTSGSENSIPSRCKSSFVKICCCKKQRAQQVKPNEQSTCQQLRQEESVTLEPRDTAAAQDQPNQELDKSVFLFSRSNKCRQLSQTIIEHRLFENVMTFMIIVSSTLLALEHPLNEPNGHKERILSIVDEVFSGIFVLEACLKIISLGLIFNGEQSYLAVSWNILDFTIVILSLISMTFRDIDVGIFKIVKLIKVLRPLRMISRDRGLQISIKALLQSIPNILNVLLISIIFFFIFGIVGVNYLKGTCYTCRFHSISGPVELDVGSAEIDSKLDCINYGGQWMKDDNNFDDILSAILTLFQMAITVGWAKQMYMGMGTRGIGLTRLPGSKPYLSLFFITYIIVCSFFILNLFVGVVITTYYREKEQLGKNFLLTERQKKWLEAKLLIIEAKPKFYMRKPKQKWRQFFYSVVMHSLFEKFITLCIVLNILVLCNKWDAQSQKVEKINEWVNEIFAIIFFFEFLLKLIAFGRRFFKDSWNQFDVAILFGTLVGLLLSNYTSIDVGATTLVIRAFRICRMLKLFRRFKSLKIIFQTFLVTLPALANVGSLLLLLLYIYSILGMFLFADVKLNYPLDDNLNFNNIGYSFLTMIRVSTGENWHEIMHAVSRSKNSLYLCIEDSKYQDFLANDRRPVSCGGRISSILFFVSFIIIVSLVFLNLFVAIILEGFDDTNQKDKKLFNHETTEYFRDAWSRFDPNATCFIRTKDFPKLMLALGAPIGWDESFKQDKIKQKLFMKELKLQSFNGYTKYQFINVLENLALNMIVNKEVECLLSSQKHFKSDNQKLMEIKEQINEQIKKAEAEQDSHMVQFVRKRTLTRMKTIKSQAEDNEVVEDESPGRNDSALIKKYVLDQDSEQNSSQIRDSRSESMHQFLTHQLIRKDTLIGQKKENEKEEASRAEQLRNLAGSFESANSDSIRSWCESVESPQKEPKPIEIKQEIQKEIKHLPLRRQQAQVGRQGPQRQLSSNKSLEVDSFDAEGEEKSQQHELLKGPRKKSTTSLKQASAVKKSKHEKQLSGDLEAENALNANYPALENDDDFRHAQLLQNRARCRGSLPATKRPKLRKSGRIQVSPPQAPSSKSGISPAASLVVGSRSQPAIQIDKSQRLAVDGTQIQYQFNNINIFINQEHDLKKLDVGALVSQRLQSLNQEQQRGEANDIDILIAPRQPLAHRKLNIKQQDQPPHSSQLDSEISLSISGDGLSSPFKDFDSSHARGQSRPCLALSPPNKRSKRKAPMIDTASIESSPHSSFRLNLFSPEADAFVTAGKASEFPAIKSKKYQTDKDADKERRRLCSTTKSANTEHGPHKTFIQALIERVSPLRRPRQYEHLDEQEREQSEEMVTQFE